LTAYDITNQVINTPNRNGFGGTRTTLSQVD
jgi:hypothetical protein